MTDLLPHSPTPPPLWREALGRALRLRRTDMRLTLAQVSQRSGVSTQFLSEIERGLKDPSSEVIEAVAEVLGLQLPQILVLAAVGVLILLARTLQRSAEQKHRPHTRRAAQDEPSSQPRPVDDPSRTDDAP